MVTLHDLSLLLRELRNSRDAVQDFLDQSASEIKSGDTGEYGFSLAKLQFDLFVKHVLELQAKFKEYEP